MKIFYIYGIRDAKNIRSYSPNSVKIIFYYIIVIYNQTIRKIGT